jgi:anti-sigma regulatory factor (Ser/Thr protein kinase)
VTGRATGTLALMGGETADRYTAALGADPAEIADVRLAVREMAMRHGFADRAGDLMLALDEVIANAQEHGRPPIEVTAWVDGRLVVEVADVGPGFDRGQVWRSHPPPPLGRRGRGLWIIRQLTDLVSIRSDEHGTIVRLELSPDPHIGA